MWRLFLSRNIETQRPRPGGDTWSAVTIDTELVGSSCQGSLISTAQALSNTLWHS
eukprot:COSAG01_NODE_1731_length_9369_cov_35.048220_4_plen_55_part_00